MLERRIREILRRSIQLDDGINQMRAENALLGAVPELDFMAVTSVILEIEEAFDIVIEHDEITAETFETLGTLVRFVREKGSALIAR